MSNIDSIIKTELRNKKNLEVIPLWEKIYSWYEEGSSNLVKENIEKEIKRIKSQFSNEEKEIKEITKIPKKKRRSK